MDSVLASLVGFLAVLNPFALCLYLANAMEDLDRRSFIVVLLRASLMSYLVFILFAVSGETLLESVLGVRREAMRIFGGIIFFNVAYTYVTRGYRGSEVLRGNIEDLPSEIALPFMIGAGTITQALIVGRAHPHHTSIAILGAGMVVAILIVIAFKLLRDGMRGTKERIFNRWVNSLARINGLIIGALSTEMVVRGIHDLWTLRADEL
jgi:multiple antibiotic resistance protein